MDRWALLVIALLTASAAETWMGYAFAIACVLAASWWREDDLA